jgi:hypothetical protein
MDIRIIDDTKSVLKHVFLDVGGLELCQKPRRQLETLDVRPNLVV